VFGVFSRRASYVNLVSTGFTPTLSDQGESMFWKIVLVLGILGLLLGFAVTAISAALPILTDGRTSWEEAAWGIVPGAFVLIVSFFVFLIGLIFVIVNRRKNKAAAPGIG
jgi:uncharacterized BrkB/YihY/UPF0761 family membrane protein